MLPLAGCVVVPVGATVSAIQVREVGSLGMSVALYAITVKVCEPCASPLYETGLVQVVAAAPSSEQV